MTTATLYTPAQLSETQLAKIRAFEAQTGRVLLAFQGLQQPVAELSGEEKARLAALEDELGIVVVACQG